MQNNAVYGLVNEQMKVNGNNTLSAQSKNIQVPTTAISLNFNSK